MPREHPLVRIDDERVGALDPGRRRTELRADPGRARVGRVDVQPDLAARGRRSPATGSTEVVDVVPTVATTAQAPSRSRRSGRMRNASSTGTRRSSSPSICAALSIDECVCSEQTTTRRSGIASRAAASAVSVAIDAVSSMWPCQLAGRPSSCASQPVDVLLELRQRRAGAPEDPDLVERGGQELGEDRRVRARVREVGEEPRMLPVRRRRQDQPVHVLEQRRERLRLLRRRRPEGCPRSQPGSTCASTG